MDRDVNEDHFNKYKWFYSQERLKRIVNKPQQTYREYLQVRYGPEICICFRHLDNLNLKLSHSKNSLTSLIKCRNNEIIPKGFRIKFDQTSNLFNILKINFNLIIATLIPLFISVSIAVGGAISYTIRLALFNPDVAWRDKHNPGHSNDAYRNKQYKFYSPTIDYSKLEKPPTY